MWCYWGSSLAPSPGRRPCSRGRAPGAHLEGLVGLGAGQHLVPVVAPLGPAQLAEQPLAAAAVEEQLLLLVLWTRQHLRHTHTHTHCIQTTELRAEAGRRGCSVGGGLPPPASLGS